MDGIWRPKSSDPDVQRERARERRRAWKARNPDRVAAERARHRLEGRIKKWQRTYYEKNREDYLTRKAIYRETKKEQRRRTVRESAARARGKLRADPIAYEEWRQKQRMFAEKRRRRLGKGTKPGRPQLYTPETKRIYKRLRMSLWRNLRRALAKKSANTIDLLGVTIEEFKTYMATKFTPGMSWDNYGEWEIDHIRPASSFDLTNPSEQAICFHYSNLQPLWRPDNRRKGAKVDIVAGAEATISLRQIAMGPSQCLTASSLPSPL